MRIIVFLILCFQLNLAAAVTLNCDGTVTEVQVLSSGIVRLVMVGAGLSDKAYICSASGTWEGVTSNTCKTWISQAMTALTTNKTLEVQYISGIYNSCSELPVNSASISPFLVNLKQ